MQGDAFSRTFPHMGRTLLATAAIAAALLIAPAAANAEPLRKPDGKAGCVTDPSSLVPNGTCKLARGIEDATDVEVSPDGRFAYAAAYSSNSIAIFSRDAESGELTQLDGADGCIAWDGAPIDGCAQAHGLEGPTALAISRDGENVYVTTFQLDPSVTPPVISGQLTTFDRDAGSGALTETDCDSGSVLVNILLAPTPPPSGCSNAIFPGGAAPDRNVPLSTASDVEVSPDGESVVTTSFLPSAVTNWDRNESTGALTPRECFASPRSIFPANAAPISLTAACIDQLGVDTGGPANGMGYPLDVEFSPDGDRVYAAALGLEQAATVVAGITIVGAADEPGSVAIFDRGSSNALTQPAPPGGCVDDERDPVQPGTTCTHRIGLLNPYRVNVSPDSDNFYVSSLNVFPPSGVNGPGPGELAQFNADLSQLTPPCLQQLGLPAGGLDPTAQCSLSAFGLILPSEVAFSPDGKDAYVSSLFHSVGSYERAADGTLTQDAPPTGCTVDPRHLLPGTDLLAAVCQNAVPLDAPTSIELSPDGRDAYVTSGGFLTGNPNFGPQLAGNKIVSDDAITELSPIPAAPPEPSPAPPPAAPGNPPMCGGAAATIVAVAGVPTRGTSGDDVIVGSGGGDRIKGGGGNDSVCAGGGRDRVSGGGGDDSVRGGGGRDRLKGGGGNDALKGGPGGDRIKGGGGNDALKGGPGGDRLSGGPGRDRCDAKRRDRVSGCE